MATITRNREPSLAAAETLTTSISSVAKDISQRSTSELAALLATLPSPTKTQSLTPSTTSTATAEDPETSSAKTLATPHSSITSQNDCETAISSRQNKEQLPEATRSLKEKSVLLESDAQSPGVAEIKPEIISDDKLRSVTKDADTIDPTEETRGGVRQDISVPNIEALEGAKLISQPAQRSRPEDESPQIASTSAQEDEAAMQTQAEAILEISNQAQEESFIEVTIGKSRIFRVEKHAYVAPNSPVDAVLMDRWSGEIQGRLEREIAQVMRGWMPNEFSIVLQCMMAGKSTTDLEPHIIVFCATEPIRRRLAKHIKNYGWLASYRIPCLVAVHTVSPLSTPTPSDGSGLSIGAIVGLVVVIAGFLGVGPAIVVFLLVRNRQRQRSQELLHAASVNPVVTSTPYPPYIASSKTKPAYPDYSNRSELPSEGTVPEIELWPHPHPQRVEDALSISEEGLQDSGLGSSPEHTDEISTITPLSHVKGEPLHNAEFNPPQHVRFEPFQHYWEMHSLDNSRRSPQCSEYGHPRSLCGVPLHLESLAENISKRSLGGVIIVDGNMLGLTVAHGIRKSQKGSASAPNIKGRNKTSLTLVTGQKNAEPIFISFNESTSNSYQPEFSQTIEMGKLQAPTTESSRPHRAKLNSLMSEERSTIAGRSGAIGLASMALDWATVGLLAGTFSPRNTYVIPHGDKAVESIMAESGLTAGPIEVLAGFSGPQSGTLSQTTASLWRDGGFLRARQITLASKLVRGDSGSWVVREEALLGHIVAGPASLPWAYMVPMHAIVEDIKKVYCAQKVELPLA